VEVCNGLSGSQIDDEVASAQAILIVYSHSAEMETMVRTSFPTKMTEALTAGRPILIYGPVYSSVARFFNMNNAEYGNWYEREALVKSGKMSPVRFNEIEIKYLNPQPMSLEGASRFTPDEQLIKDKYKKP
jgi:hypothetical protein